MRLDRSITVNWIAPLHRGLRRFQRTDSQASNWTLPILMYHSVSNEPEDSVAPYYRVVTSPDAFREQMALLKTEGYHGVDIKTGIEALNSKRTGESKLVVITFDDGFRSLHTTACPILKEYGFAATIYLPTALIGDKRRSFKARKCLTWSEVLEMQKDGFHFGSHTVTHPRLVDLEWPAIREELRASKGEIENRLGVCADAFAYPYAFPETEQDFVADFSELLRETGYTSCVTTIVGRAAPGDDLFRLKRLPANSCDDASFFHAKLEGAYDWIASVQAGTKQIKKVMNRRRKKRLSVNNPNQPLPVNEPHCSGIQK